MKRSWKEFSIQQLASMSAVDLALVSFDGIPKASRAYLASLPDSAIAEPLVDLFEDKLAELLGRPSIVVNGGNDGPLQADRADFLAERAERLTRERSRILSEHAKCEQAAGRPLPFPACELNVLSPLALQGLKPDPGVKKDKFSRDRAVEVLLPEAIRFGECKAGLADLVRMADLEQRADQKRLQVHGLALACTLGVSGECDETMALEKLDDVTEGTGLSAPHFQCVYFLVRRVVVDGKRKNLVDNVNEWLEKRGLRTLDDSVSQRYAAVIRRVTRPST